METHSKTRTVRYVRLTIPTPKSELTMIKEVVADVNYFFAGGL